MSCVRKAPCRCLYETPSQQADPILAASAVAAGDGANTAARTIYERGNPRLRTAGAFSLARWVTGGWEALEVGRRLSNCKTVPRLPGARPCGCSRTAEPQPAQTRDHPELGLSAVAPGGWGGGGGGFFFQAGFFFWGGGGYPPEGPDRPSKIVPALSPRQPAGPRQKSITKKVTTVPDHLLLGASLP